MASLKQFREFALECMQRAAETRDERQRQALLGMAERWMRVAVRAERSSINVLDDHVPRLDEEVPLVPLLRHGMDLRSSYRPVERRPERARAPLRSPRDTVRRVQSRRAG
jgi:hypothetical protein